jgi:tripartite-type tricarboxylate transporter receptor subunit TctC
VKPRIMSPHALIYAALLVAWAPVFAQQKGDQSYPVRPVRWVVPYAAGGLPDTIVRVAAPKVVEDLGQQLVIDNRGGAGGIVGSEIVARAAPDGYNFLVADVGQLAINQFVYSKLPYSPEKDFKPVSLIATSVLYLVVNNSVPVKNFGELVALAKSKPGQLNYGSSGIGSIHHLSTEALKSAFGLNIVHVPYKGTGETIPALLGGQVAIAYAALPSIEAHIKAGRVRAVAVSSIKRTARMSEVPTVAELGSTGYDFTPLIGLVAPAATPPAVIARMSRTIAKAMQAPEVVQRYSQLDIEPVGSTPEEYGKRLRDAVKKYADAVKFSGTRIDN